MAENSSIEWTDATFNPWEGCTKVGPGCDNCYAESRNRRFGGDNWGAGAPRRRTSTSNWINPLRWNSKPFFECIDCGSRGERTAVNTCLQCDSANLVHARRRVFCASLSDWLDNEVPIEWLADLLDLIRRTPNLDWLLLSKRIGNWKSRMSEVHLAAFVDDEREGEFFDWLDSWVLGRPPVNVWLGATVVNQVDAERDVSKLLSVPSDVRFLSIEPLLGAIDFAGMWVDHSNPAVHQNVLEALDWVIVGGESGHRARPLHPEWVRSLRDQCAATDTPFLFKQWGKQAHGRSLDGHIHHEFPACR